MIAILSLHLLALSGLGLGGLCVRCMWQGRTSGRLVAAIGVWTFGLWLWLAVFITVPAR